MGRHKDNGPPDPRQHYCFLLQARVKVLTASLKSRFSNAKEEYTYDLLLILLEFYFIPRNQGLLNLFETLT